MDRPAPTPGHELVVPREWIDYSQHMNVGYYLLAFELAAAQFFERIGLGESYRKRTDHAYFAVESHIMYLAEASLGDRLRFSHQLLAFDDKRVRVFDRMIRDRDGRLAATHEVVYVHVNLTRRGAAPCPEEGLRILAQTTAAHARLPWPAEAGRAIVKPAP